VGPDHLSRLELGESGGSYDDQLSNAHLFHVEVVPNYLEYFSLFLVQVNVLLIILWCRRSNWWLDQYVINLLQENYIKWVSVNFYAIVSLIMNAKVHYGNVTMELQEFILEGKLLLRKFCKLAFGGRLSLRMQKNTQRVAMSFNGLAKHCISMKYLYILYQILLFLINGQLISLGLFILLLVI